jgi:lysozyme family protein
MSLTHLLRREGGFVDHPADRGGATNFGITAATLGDWRGLGRPASRDEVKALTEREARAIYTQRYLKDTGFDQIRNAKLRDLLLDCAVHHGPARATKWLQEAVGVTADGKVGPRTLAAVRSFGRAPSATSLRMTTASAEKLRMAILAKRIIFFGELITNDPRQAVFAKGWMRRVAEFL